MDLIYSEIIERMKEAGKLKNDSTVARVLGIAPQALSNHKKRNKIPSGLVVKFANLYDVNIDWLITGEGVVFKKNRGASGETDDRYRKLLSLTDDEALYVGRLLKILRSENKSSKVVMEHTIDSLFNLSASDEKKPASE